MQRNAATHSLSAQAVRPTLEKPGNSGFAVSVPFLSLPVHLCAFLPLRLSRERIRSPLIP